MRVYKINSFYRNLPTKIKIMKKILALLFTISILFSCGKNLGENTVKNDINTANNSQVLENKKIIYTSFYPIYFLTKSLLWDKAEVINIVPTWWEAHEYEPSLKQIWDLKKSDLIVLNWLWMESYEEKFIKSVWSWKIILLSEKIENLIKLDNKGHKDKHKHNWHDHWNIDPHTWLSPKVYKNMANLLILELEKAWFKDLDKSILLKLEELEKNYDLWLKDCEVKELITSHKAFWYLARDYALVQHPVFGISPEEEPSAKDIANVVDLIKKEKLKYIFSEEFVSPKFAETLIKETWTIVLNLHTIETLTPDEELTKENYVSIMTKNLEKLKTWLKCK